LFQVGDNSLKSFENVIGIDKIFQINRGDIDDFIAEIDQIFFKI